MKMNIFICHASEDKDTIVRPMAAALRDRGFVVWYDEFSLQVGDSLRQEIDRGLSSADLGVVVLSPAFFEKQWPQWELDGLVAKEIENAQKVILPVWHNIVFKQVMSYSPPLAGRLAVSTAQGIDNVVNSLERAIRAASDVSREGRKSPESVMGASLGFEDFTGYWDLEVTSIERINRKNWMFLCLRGYLDRWEHNPMETLLYAHIRTSFSLLHHVFKGSDSRLELINIGNLTSETTELPEKSGKIGDLILDLDPPHCLRIRYPYSGDYDDIMRIPYSVISRIIITGESSRRIEFHCQGRLLLLCQAIYPSDDEAEIIDSIHIITDANPHITVDDQRL